MGLPAQEEDIEMPSLSDVEMGEIALKLVKARLLRSPLPIPRDFHQEIGNASRESGVPREKLVAFYETLLPELLGTMLNRESVSLTTS